MGGQTPVNFGIRRVRNLLRRSSDTINCWLYPELKYFETWNARKQAVKQSLRSGESGWSPYVAIAVGACLLYGLAEFQMPIAEFVSSRGLATWIGVVLWSFVAVGIVALQVGVVLWDCRRRVRLRLREMLSKRGSMLCGACGYDLTGNTSGICPECGTRTLIAKKTPSWTFGRKCFAALLVTTFVALACWDIARDAKASNAVSFYKENPLRLLVLLALTFAVVMLVLLADYLRKRWRSRMQPTNHSQ